MRNNNGSMVAGVVLIGLGVMFLLSTWLRINLWSFFWPGLLIVLGVMILARSRTVPAGTRSDFVLLGDVRRTGEAPIVNEDVWLGIGDIDLDLTRAALPLGETVLQYSGFIGDVRVTVPGNVGVSVMANGFISNIKQAGKEQPTFLIPNRFETDGYATAERKLRLITTFFIHDLKLRQV